MDQLRRGINVASKIEATDGRTGRSFDDSEQEERREVAVGLEGVRERISRRTGVRAPRFGGIITGVAFFNP